MERRMVFEHLFDRGTVREQFQHVRDPHAGSADARPTAAFSWLDGDSFEERRRHDWTIARGLAGHVRRLAIDSLGGRRVGRNRLDGLDRPAIAKRGDCGTGLASLAPAPPVLLARRPFKRRGARSENRPFRSRSHRPHVGPCGAWGSSHQTVPLAAIARRTCWAGRTQDRESPHRGLRGWRQVRSRRGVASRRLQACP